GLKLLLTDLLKISLEIPPPANGLVTGCEFLGKICLDPRLGRPETSIEIDAGENRFKSVRKNRGLVLSLRDRFALPQAQGRAESQSPRHAGQCLLAYQSRAQLREDSFRRIRKRRQQILTRHQIQDRISQELQSLVIALPGFS